MTHEIEVRCPDDTVATQVRDWLRRAEIHPPGHLTFEIEISDIVADRSDGREPFRQGALDIWAGAPDGGVEITWRTAPAGARVDADTPSAVIHLSSTAAQRLDECIQTLFTATLVFVLRRVGWHHIHAATAVDPAGRGWLMAGNARAGKSTTAALLASAGWPVGTDDTAFLAARGERTVVMGYHAPIAIRPDMIDRFAGLGRGGFAARRQKGLYLPEELGGEWVSCVDPSLVLFPTIGDERTAVDPITRSDALKELIRWSAWVILEPRWAQEHLGLLTRLAGQCQAFRVSLGRDLLTRPALLHELIS